MSNRNFRISVRTGDGLHSYRQVTRIGDNKQREMQSNCQNSIEDIDQLGMQVQRVMDRSANNLYDNFGNNQAKNFKSCAETTNRGSVTKSTDLTDYSNSYHSQDMDTTSEKRTEPTNMLLKLTLKNLEAIGQLGQNSKHKETNNVSIQTDASFTLNREDSEATHSTKLEDEESVDSGGDKNQKIQNPLLGNYLIISISNHNIFIYVIL